MSKKQLAQIGKMMLSNAGVPFSWIYEEAELDRLPGANLSIRLPSGHIQRAYVPPAEGDEWVRHVIEDLLLNMADLVPKVAQNGGAA